ncbi:DNA topoisomerase I, mitochondrial [Diachasma alloeum]|uniref:DNA topoisomerase I, mitochondrial n=1 Tax=Diachasma alloeum TaxID=454923 RepID=UPI0007384370|nr:DNA topoisomerase I, mitochondrial [Diachasma alloeum]
MELEETPNRPKADTEKGAKENSSAAGNHGDAHMNGISNGYESRKDHKSDHRTKERSHKSEHRDKDRSRSDKDKSHKSEHRDKNKERHKHSSSSSSKDKDRHGSGSSTSKDKDKDKDNKEKKSSSSSSSRDKDKEREHKSSSSTKDKEREKSRDHHHKSSSSRDKESSKESKHHSSSNSKDKENSRSKDKDKEKHRHSSKDDKDKDKSSSKDKDRKHSSEKDKERHSNSYSSIEKDKARLDKDRHRHDREKDKHRHDKDKERSKHREDKERKDEPKIKVETDEFNHQSVSYNQQYEVKLEIKDESLTQLDAEDDGNSSDENELYIKEEEDEEYKQENSTDDGNNPRLSELHNTTLKTEEESEEDIPLASRRSTSSPSVKRKVDSSDEDEVPLSARKKVKKESDKSKKKKKRKNDDEDDDFVEKKSKKKAAKPPKTESSTPSPRKKKKEEEEVEVWKWWEEKPREDGKKWTFLEHKGPVFAPDYEPLPPDVKFCYNGKEMKLSPETEEVATFYARMLNHDYTTKQVFNDNFFHDWREVMTEDERRKIMDLSKCNFTPMHEYFNLKSEERKQMSKEEKKVIKEKNEEIQKEYGICTIDGHPEKIGNFRIEPPGLFRGRGEHPKMGKLKKRVLPEDVIINCSKDSKFPKPPSGHKWKEIRHDPGVTWLASWNENIQGQVKYVMLNPSSKLKGQKDMDKYNTARRLASLIDNIRKKYREDWKSKEMKVRQRAVALYFIDKLALRAGNEKDEDQADTVGCCSLRIEHISLHEKKDDEEYVVVFDFLGKDSIRYYNKVPVEKRVFKNLELFMENKSAGDDLFDRITTTDLNKHLNELMDGLTAKVFRTYNASITLQQQLEKLTNPDDSIAEKLLSYNRANRAVAILCNHQRSVPKGHAKTMENLKGKIEAKKEAIKEAEAAVKDAKREIKGGSVTGKALYDKKKKQLERLKEQLTKLEVQETDREENKTIALGTSKLNYLDPRISVAWCKKYGVPIEKIYNKTQRDKFKWAIDMATEDYDFTAAPEDD